jgi:hypothetical protein
MNTLSSLYELDLPKIVFHERKLSITNHKTIVRGGFKTGKTYLIYDYLSNFLKEDILYIDCSDYKNDMESISKSLDEFIESNPIKVLVLEDFDFSFALSKVESIIISTYLENHLEDFEELYVQGLDFEEYLLFDTKHQNVSQSFNSFLKFGNFPESIEFSEIKRTKRNYEICKLFCSDATEFEILMLLIKNSGEKKSVFQLFNVLKKTHKISKDRFYKTCELYEKNRIIFFVQKYEHPKSVKRLFVFNHGLLDNVSYTKNFNNLFKNMVFLEIQKRFEDLYYLDYIDFYLPQEDQAVLAIPFFSTYLLGNAMAKIVNSINKYDIKKITVVTIGTEETVYFDKVEANVLSFSNWVLSL